MNLITQDQICPCMWLFFKMQILALKRIAACVFWTRLSFMKLCSCLEISKKERKKERREKESIFEKKKKKEKEKEKYENDRSK